MPTYDYRCKACGHELEVVQAFDDDPLTHCEACGAEELRKVFSAVGIAFKGSGFYKTDSRGSGSKGSSGASSDKGSSDKSSSDKSSSESSTSSSSPASSPAAAPAS